MSKLKEFRIKHKISLNSLANIMDIDPATLCRLEQKRFKPSVGTLIKIQRFLNADRAYDEDRITLEELIKDYWS